MMQNRDINIHGGVRDSPPMTNAERQELFRQRHPNYYREYRRKQKAEMEARLAERVAAKAAAAARPMLALPAPEPVVVLQLPLFAERDLVEVERVEGVMEPKRILAADQRG